jgi:glycerol kinase
MQTPKPSFKICSPLFKKRRGFVLVLDAGTTGVKAFVFDGNCQIVAKAYQKISKSHPKTGWVEQDPYEIVRASKAVLKKVASVVDVSDIKGMGVTNQREATVVWNRHSGKPVYPVIGWEDTRTRRVCVKMRQLHGTFIRQRTGLNVDSYFSASKIKWILDHASHAQNLAFGTIDSWLLWNLCEHHPHITDETNASRTLLFDIHTRQWNQKLLRLFGVPNSLLPSVLPSRAHFGALAKEILGREIPIVAVCGDQQASTYAAMRAYPKNRFTLVAAGPSPRPHTTKVTYGTGTFLVQVLGKTFSLSPSFFTTLVPAIVDGSCYALEMKIEGSGETVDRLLKNPPKLGAYFRKLSGKVNRLIVQLPRKPQRIVVDGGVARNGFVVEIQQKITGIPACLQSPYDGTALGCALLVWDQTG